MVALEKKNSKHWLSSVVSAKQFSRKDIDLVLEKAGEMESLCRGAGASSLLAGKIMATLFYEESTRTRLSFETAMLRLGGSVIGTENARMFSSVAKGESLEDTIRIVDGYVDVIVMRHNEEGASARAAAISTVPVINAGDGPGEHPTQALLDLFTIKKEFGVVEGKTIALVGDLCHGRTVRSLSQLLSLFKGVKLVFVAPERLSMRQDIKDFLFERGIPFVETEDLEEALPSADVLYMTRIQKERFESLAEYERYKMVYVLNGAKAGMMKSNAIIMHPLPRVGEITPEIDSNSRARYFEQAENGLFVRMALLTLLLER